MKDRELNQAIEVLEMIKKAYYDVPFGSSLNWDKVTDLITELISRNDIEKIKNSTNTQKLNEYRRLVDFIIDKIDYSFQKKKIAYICYWKMIIIPEIPTRTYTPIGTANSSPSSSTTPRNSNDDNNGCVSILLRMLGAFIILYILVNMCSSNKDSNHSDNSSQTEQEITTTIEEEEEKEEVHNNIRNISETEIPNYYSEEEEEEEENDYIEIEEEATYNEEEIY